MAGGRLIELEAASALARCGSFRAASASVGLSPTAFSRTIANLEERLGVQLFARTTRSVRPTEVGARFLALAEEGLCGIRSAVAEATELHGRPSGVLRLTCATGAARRILAPVLLPFLRRYPRMELELVTDARLVDLVAGGFDAGIRAGHAVPRSMESTPIGPRLRYVLVASPDFLATHPAPETPRDLRHVPCLRFRRPDGAIEPWSFRRGRQRLSLDVSGRLTLDEPTLLREAALAGEGIAYLARWSVETDLTAGRLATLLDDWMPEEPGLCLYYPRHAHHPAGLDALIAMVKAQT